MSSQSARSSTEDCPETTFRLLAILLGRSLGEVREGESMGSAESIPIIGDEVRQRIAADDLADVPTTIEVKACLSRAALLHHSNDVKMSAFASLAKHDLFLAGVLALAATFSSDSELRWCALRVLFEINSTLGFQRSQDISTSDPDESLRHQAIELLRDYATQSTPPTNSDSVETEQTGRVIAAILNDTSLGESRRMEGIQQLLDTNLTVGAAVLSSVQAQPNSLFSQQISQILRRYFPSLFTLLVQ
jgi:hypothetical protein